MDPTLLSLLDSIPQKPPRSKLETHRELIRQLRRKGCTYRDIVRACYLRSKATRSHIFANIYEAFLTVMRTQFVPFLCLYKGAGKL